LFIDDQHSDVSMTNASLPPGKVPQDDDVSYQEALSSDTDTSCSEEDKIIEIDTGNEKGSPTSLKTKASVEVLNKILNNH